MSESGDAGVPEENVSTEFECALCLRLLLEPVSVSCGHTFCRSCIQASVEHRAACPLCRQPIIAGRNVNVLIQNIIQERYPVSFSKRLEEQRQDLLEDNRGHCYDADGNTGVTQRENPGIRYPMFMNARVRETVEIYFPGNLFGFNLQELNDEHLLDHALETDRKFAVRWKGGIPSREKPSVDPDVCATAAAISNENNAVAGTGGNVQMAQMQLGGSSSSTSNPSSFGYVFRIENTDRDPETDQRRVVAICEDRVHLKSETTITRPETGAVVTLVETAAIIDDPVDVAELLLPVGYMMLGTSGPQQEDPDLGEEGGVNGSNGEKTLAVYASETDFYLNKFMGRLGIHGMQSFIQTHGRSRLNSTNFSFRNIQEFSFYCCKVVHASADDKSLWLKTTDLKLRLRSIHQILKVADERMTAADNVLVMPGALTWLKMRSQLGSLALLILIILLLYLKGNGYLEKRPSRGEYWIN